MDLRFFRVFSTELLKLAVEIQDPDIRRALAEKKGKEYLVGGQLPSNAPNEQDSQIKIGWRVGASDPDVNPVSTFDSFGPRKSKKERADTYKKVMDTAATGVGGAFLGNRITGMGYNISNLKPFLPRTETMLEGGKLVEKALEGAPKLKWREMPAKMHAVSALAGAGLALADRAYRRRSGLQQDKVDQSASGQAKLAFTSPAEELSSASHRGKTVQKITRVGHKPAVPGLTGRLMP